MEAIHCLTVMGGDLEQAAQLLITRAEMGQDIRPTQAQVGWIYNKIKGLSLDF